MKKTDISIIAGLLISLVFTFFTDTNARAADIRQNTLRLHIIADDNSRDAQNIKLAVKDSISSLCSEIYCDTATYTQALEKTQENLLLLETATNQVLQQCGAIYSATCGIETFYFDTTKYKNFTLPRGEYTALTIRLGKAQGQNWWCAVYPSLCLSAAVDYENSDCATFVTADNILIRFKAVEIWEKLKFSFSETAPVYTNIS